jgi:hypothetical protein
MPSTRPGAIRRLSAKQRIIRPAAKLAFESETKISLSLCEEARLSGRLSRETRCRSREARPSWEKTPSGKCLPKVGDRIIHRLFSRELRVKQSDNPSSHPFWRSRVFTAAQRRTTKARWYGLRHAKGNPYENAIETAPLRLGSMARSQSRAAGLSQQSKIEQARNGRDNRSKCTDSGRMEPAFYST